MKKGKRNKGNKIQDLHFRVTQKDKENLSKEAKRLGLSVSEYIRTMLNGKKYNDMPSNKVSMMITLIQDIATYIEEKYSCEDDIELVERLEKLWEVLL